MSHDSNTESNPPNPIEELLEDSNSDDDSSWELKEFDDKPRDEEEAEFSKLMFSGENEKKNAPIRHATDISSFWIRHHKIRMFPSELMRIINTFMLGDVSSPFPLSPFFSIHRHTRNFVRVGVRKNSGAPHAEKKNVCLRVFVFSQNLGYSHRNILG